MDSFRFLTAGESHGRTLGVTVDGVPAGLPLAAEEINVDLARRQKGYGRGARQQIEHDEAEVGIAGEDVRGLEREGGAAAADPQQVGEQIDRAGAGIEAVGAVDQRDAQPVKIGRAHV